MGLLVQIYRSARRDEMYLFVESALGLEKVPPELLQRFGEPEPVMKLMLSADRPLARADVHEVMDKIGEQGFYFQMPPVPGRPRRSEPHDG